MNPAYRCPTCGSDDTATLAATHAHGTSRSAGLLVGEVGGRLGLGGLAGTTATDAAATAAPPEPRGLGLSIVVGSVFAAGSLWAVFVLTCNTDLPAGDKAKWSALAMLIGAVAVAACVWEFRRHRRFNATVHEPAVDRWRRTWVCRRCGGRFVP